MAEAISTPRISAPYMDNFLNQTIRLIGKVKQLRGDQAVIESDGNVTVHLNRDSHLTVGNGIEIVGKVNNDLSIKVLQATDLGENMNYQIINQLVEFSHRYHEIFYDRSVTHPGL